MLLTGNITFESLIWFCAGGKLFFVGMTLLTISAGVAHLVKSIRKRVTLQLLSLISIAIIILSATPLHPIFYISGLALYILCHIQCLSGPFKTCIGGLFVLFCLIIIFLELPRHFCKTIDVEKNKPIVVIGDSISAGLGNQNEMTWPKQLSEQIGTPTINLSRAGATVNSAFERQLTQVPAETGLVLLEIGGNDLLNRNDLGKFKNDSEALLRKLCASGHKVVWMELPLLPHYYPYGRIQRKLAGKYHIDLIPKSVLAGVFSAQGTTSDGMHLTAKGHELMAQKLYGLLQIE